MRQKRIDNNLEETIIIENWNELKMNSHEIQSRCERTRHRKCVNWVFPMNDQNNWNWQNAEKRPENRLKIVVESFLPFRRVKSIFILSLRVWIHSVAGRVGAMSMAFIKSSERVRKRDENGNRTNWMTKKWQQWWATMVMTVTKN